MMGTLIPRNVTIPLTSPAETLPLFIPDWFGATDTTSAVLQSKFGIPNVVVPQVVVPTQVVVTPSVLEIPLETTPTVFELPPPSVIQIPPPSVTQISPLYVVEPPLETVPQVEFIMEPTPAVFEIPLEPPPTVFELPPPSVIQIPFETAPQIEFVEPELQEETILESQVEPSRVIVEELREPPIIQEVRVQKKASKLRELAAAQVLAAGELGMALTGSKIINTLKKVPSKFKQSKPVASTPTAAVPPVGAVPIVTQPNVIPTKVEKPVSSSKLKSSIGASLGLLAAFILSVYEKRKGKRQQDKKT